METVDAERRVVFLPRIPFEMVIPGAGIKVVRKQFPVRLGYSGSPYKAQGKTFVRAGADYRTADVFGHGQQYVAQGRVCRAEDFGVLVSPARIITRPDGTVVTLVMNVVYPD